MVGFFIDLNGKTNHKFLMTGYGKGGKFERRGNPLYATCNNVKKKQKAVSESSGKPRDGGSPPRGGGAPPRAGEEAAFRQSKRAPG